MARLVASACKVVPVLIHATSPNPLNVKKTKHKFVDKTSESVFNV